MTRFIPTPSSRPSPAGGEGAKKHSSPSCPPSPGGRGRGEGEPSFAESTIGSAFDLPPEEALQFFRAKGLDVSFDWRDMLHEAHDTAFTVAKMMDIDLLSGVKEAVDGAIAEGKTFREFRDGLAPLLQKRGWWGAKEMADPLTGEIKTVQLGSPRRLETIFRTNMRTAYAAGHWKQIEDNAKSAPYLMYDAVDDGRTRPQHRAWDELVLRYDDPWWKTHYPPNGWNCRCGVIQMDKGQLKALGKSAPDSAPPSPMREWINPRTGEILDVPEGIDPGWAYHPGREGRAALLKNLSEKLEDAPEGLAHASLNEIAASDVFASWLDRPDGAFPVLRLREEAAAAIGAKRKVAVFSAESAEKNRGNHADLTIEDYRALPQIGAEPTLVVQDGENTVVLVKKGAAVYWAAVKAARTGGEETFVTSFRKTNSDDIRRLLSRGKVIYGKWE